jgi:hypothetical protein
LEDVPLPIFDAFFDEYPAGDGFVVVVEEVIDTASIFVVVFDMEHLFNKERAGVDTSFDYVTGVLALVFG